MRKKSLFITAVFLCVSLITNAQIIYTDINDGVPTGIDFNQDGTPEFDISDMMSTGDYVEYYNYGVDNNIHAIGTQATEDWDVPACVSNGFTIDANSNWEGAGDCAINGWGGGNSSITQNQDTYLAVRFNLGGTDVYYGWVMINVDNSENVTYKEYAYNSVANTPINAGEVDVSAILVTSISVQSQNNATEINTVGGSLQMITTILPTNADDNSVSWSVINDSGTATINSNGLLTAIADGDITVKAIANDGSSVIGSIVITITNQSTGITVYENSKITISPNPAANYIRFSNISEDDYDVEIISIDGRLMKRIKINSYTNIIDISELQNGSYIIRANSSNEFFTKQLIKR